MAQRLMNCWKSDEKGPPERSSMLSRKIEKEINYPLEMLTSNRRNTKLSRLNRERLFPS